MNFWATTQCWTRCLMREKYRTTFHSSAKEWTNRNSAKAFLPSSSPLSLLQLPGSPSTKSEKEERYSPLCPPGLWRECRLINMTRFYWIILTIRHQFLRYASRSCRSCPTTKMIRHKNELGQKLSRVDDLRGRPCLYSFSFISVSFVAFIKKVRGEQCNEGVTRRYAAGLSLTSSHHLSLLCAFIRALGGMLCDERVIKWCTEGDFLTTSSQRGLRHCYSSHLSLKTSRGRKFNASVKIWMCWVSFLFHQGAAYIIIIIKTL